MIPVSIVPQLEDVLARHTKQSGRIEECGMLGGGSINDACRIQYCEHTYFLKWNFANRYPGMFQAEARGLALLSKSQTISIPRVIGTGNNDKYAFLLLEYIEQGHSNSSFWEHFGHALASMHKHTAENHGLDHDNYIGSLRQFNTQSNDWPSFFMNQRLAVQLRMAIDNGMADNSLIRDFDELYKKLPDYFPPEPPALLHGDLWSGNYLCNSYNQPVLIDPAVYYGHREMDIGMTKLFGGFDRRFYDAYNQAWPLESGWQQRIDLCNIYPLMVHVNLFGGAYLMQVKRILRKLT